MSTQPAPSSPDMSAVNKPARQDMREPQPAPSVLDGPVDVSNVKIDDIEPKRTRVFGDLVNAIGSILIAVVVALFAIYLKGITSGVESDVRTAATAINWVFELPTSLLEQLAIVVITVSVLIQLIMSKRWMQIVFSIIGLLAGFAGTWATSFLISSLHSTILINAVISNSTMPGTSLLPDFYAAMAAFLTLAGPRRMRSAVKWGWNILYATAIILVVVSWNSVVGVLISLCIGRAVGALIRFIVGTQPTGAWGTEVASALHSIGLQPASLVRRHVSAADANATSLHATLDDDLIDNSRIYDMQTVDGAAYTVSVLDNQTHAIGYFNQLCQSFRLSGVTIRHDRSAEDAIHHHMSMLLGLRNLGLATQTPYGVADSGESSILVLNAQYVPTPLDVQHASDDDVRALMQYLRTAHERGYTHRHIQPGTLARLHDGTPYIAGWQNGDCASHNSNISLDIVQLLSICACACGVKRTVKLAREVWDDATLVNVSPFVQRAAVPSATRAMPDWNKNVIGQLRATLNAITPENVSESVDKVTLSRFSWRSFLPIVLLVIAVVVIFTQLKPEAMIHAIKDANPWIMLLCIVFSFIAWTGAATSLGGFMDRQHIKSWFGLLCSQMSAGFTAVSMPAGVGPAFVNLQFLRKSGYSNTVATAIMSAVLAVQAVTTVALLLAIGVFTGRNTLTSAIPSNTLILVIAAVALIIAIAMAIPPVRKLVTDKYLPLVKSYARSLIETLTQPREFIISMLGSLVMNAAHGLGFWAALLAFGYNMNVFEVIFVYLLANTLGSAVPTPGGLGAIEATLSVAFTAVGVPSTIALSATLLYRVAFYWMRIPVGAWAMKWLTKHNLI